MLYEVITQIYLNGPILTIDDRMPRAEAVAVANGLIVAVGDLESVMAHRENLVRAERRVGRAALMIRIHHVV